MPRYDLSDPDYLEVRKILGKKVYKRPVSLSHPKSTFRLSDEFREFGKDPLDLAEGDLQLAIVDILSRYSRGLRRWRLDRELEDIGMGYNPFSSEMTSALESLVHKGVLVHYRVPTS